MSAKALQPQVQNKVRKCASVATAHEEIASLAHAYWLEHDCTEGLAEEDWLRAERELKCWARQGGLLK